MIPDISHIVLQLLELFDIHQRFVVLQNKDMPLSGHDGLSITLLTNIINLYCRCHDSVVLARDDMA